MEKLLFNSKDVRKNSRVTYFKESWDFKKIAICIAKQGEDESLGEIVRQWKGSSAFQINRELKRKGSLWSNDYFDRVIRDDEHFWNCISYIHRNPVRAGLVKELNDWPFSSVGHGWPLPTY